MTHASLSARALALAALFPAATVAADEQPASDRTETIPPQCAQFATIFAGAAERPDSEHTWRQLLSFAVCIQDASAAAVSEPDQLEEMVQDLSQRLALPMTIYLDALEHGGAPIQLRAAFQIGMAYVALGTRARSAIAAPPDLATNPSAQARYRELHVRIEPLLLPARRAARVSFQAIDEAAAQDPAFATNEVERNMVCMARQMLPGLRDTAPEQLRLVRAPACAGEAVTAAAR